MCTVSMVGDFYSDKWRDRYNTLPTNPFLNLPGSGMGGYGIGGISREEFDALKREVADMKELLKRAKAYDEKNGEPDCELDEKVALLRRVAQLVGVDLSDVIGQPKQ
jgi:hypothetical protein